MAYVNVNDFINRFINAVSVNISHRNLKIEIPL